MPRDGSYIETRTKIAYIAHRAADIIERRGHCKDRLQDDQGRVCLIKAVSIAHDELGLTSWLFPQLAQHMGRENDVDAIHWNNHPDTTARMVIDRLRAV